MTENYYAIAGVLEAIKNKFEQQDGDTPVWEISPVEFREVCVAYGIDAETAFDMASFAIALVKGMAKNPKDVASMCSGGHFGSSIIVAFEDLKVELCYNK